MLPPNEVFHVVEYVLHLRGVMITALATQPSTVVCMLYATVVIRLVSALIQLSWFLMRIACRLRRWRRQRARVRRRTASVPAVQTGMATRAEDFGH